MSKTICATESWLGGANSRQAYFSSHLAAIPDKLYEQTSDECLDSLKYLGCACDGGKQKKSLTGNGEKLVHGVLFMEVVC
jgi:hypothetical protein